MGNSCVPGSVLNAIFSLIPKYLALSLTLSNVSCNHHCLPTQEVRILREQVSLLVDNENPTVPFLKVRQTYRQESSSRSDQAVLLTCSPSLGKGHWPLSTHTACCLNKARRQAGSLGLRRKEPGLFGIPRGLWAIEAVRPIYKFCQAHSSWHSGCLPWMTIYSQPL